MPNQIGAYVNPTALARAAFADGLGGMTKSAVARYSLLRLVMDRDEALARVTEKRNLATLKVPGKQVSFRMPDDELEMIRRQFPGESTSFLIRYALALRECDGDTELARQLATTRGPGRPRKEPAAAPA